MPNLSMCPHGFRRTNELKSEMDISDDIVTKFKQFWVHFKDEPLKGGIPRSHFFGIPCII